MIHETLITQGIAQGKDIATEGWREIIITLVVAESGAKITGEEYILKVATLGVTRLASVP